MSGWVERRKELIAAWSAEECPEARQVIPAEAVEAAAKVAYKGVSGGGL